MKTTKEQIIADITAKVEAKLASHKVELATYLESATKAIADGLKNEASYYSDFKASLNAIIVKAREIEIKYNVLMSNINEPIFQMEKQAKELGLDIKGTDVYKKSQSVIDSIEKRKEVINQIQNNIQKFGF